MVDDLQSAWDSAISSLVMELPKGIKALLLLLLAWIIAVIAKNIFNNVLVRLGFGKRLAKTPLAEDEQSGNDLLENIGKLVYFIVFILFLPTVFGVLNMTEVAAPISNMMSKFLNFLPNVLAAAIILIIGIFVAKLVKQLIDQFFKTVRINEWLQNVLPSKDGEQNNDESLTSVITNIVYVLILIPFVIIALESLNIQTISRPLEAVLNKVLTITPNIFIAVILIVAGYFIGKVVGNLLTNLLERTNINAVYESLGIGDKVEGKKFDLAKFLGNIVQIIIVLFVTVEAFQLVNFEVLNTIGGAIIAYLPFLLSSVLILGVGLLLANLVGNWIQKNTNNTFSAMTIKTVIIVFALFMTLDQLKFATNIVNIAFLVILTGLMIAFALSFGLGGREFAKKQLEKLDNKFRS